MEFLAALIAQILAPLSVGIVITSIGAGLFFGAFYNYKLEVPDFVIYHKLITGWGFIAFIFMYRLFTTGFIVTNFFGWIGIAIIWGIFCASIYIGKHLVQKVTRRHTF